MNDVICKAIENKQLLRFKYHFHLRLVEPHTYGIDTRGHLALRAYQTEGVSDHGRVPDWKLFLESDIENLHLMPDTFENARPKYKRGDKAFSRIFAQL